MSEPKEEKVIISRTMTGQQWTAEELEIMRQGGSVPIIVNGTVFQAKMGAEAIVRFRDLQDAKR